MTTLATTQPTPWFSRYLATLAGNRVLLFLIAASALLVVLHPAQAMASLTFTLHALWSIAPFFLLSIVLAAYTTASGMDQMISRALSGHAAGSVGMAALVGAVSPFCSCGVIPLIAALLRSGVPLAPVMAFWIASPIMDPEMFILTAATIGPGFAVAKTLAAIAMGLAAGFVILLLQRSGQLNQPLRGSTRTCGCGGAPEEAAIAWRFWGDAERRGKFARELTEVGGFLGKWLTLAFFLESLMVAYVPADWVASMVGDHALAVPLAALVGIPSYLNGYAAIGLVRGLLDMGMTPGAALTFMTAGGVSSIPAAIAVYSLVKRPVFLTYLLLGLMGSMAAGWTYGLLA